MNISVIVPTYNRPKALKLCLLSLAGQSVLPSEVLIADDGSGPGTGDMVRELQEALKHRFPIKHIWQEDSGFRKPRILNETVRQASGDYLIFIDGDCMAHRHFIKAHRDYSAPDAVLSGKRVEIGELLSLKLQESGKVMNRFTFRLLWDAARRRSRRVAESIQIRNPWLRQAMHRDRIYNDGVWGCNFSLSKELFVAINGCDEEFLDGSIEDNDIGIRALNQGKRLRSVRGLAIIFHLWHKSSWNFDNTKYQHNLEILNRRIANKEPVCKQGINAR